MVSFLSERSSPKNNFDGTVKALIAKFGKPTTDTTGVVQNAMGASFANRDLTWKSPTASLNVQQRQMRVAQSLVLLADPVGLQNLAKGEADIARAAAKKL